ncbi:MAG: hypothetical protein ABR568_22965, partial [Pyrinomonadaceae bacterium]
PTQAGLFPGYAPGPGLAPRLLGQRPHQGHSPKMYGNSKAGHSHRLTSGGIAEADEAMTFGAKPLKA